jgi:hypothetical protein
MADIYLLFTGFNCREFPATDGKTERRLQFYRDVRLSLFTYNTKWYLSNLQVGDSANNLECIFSSQVLCDSEQHGKALLIAGVCLYPVGILLALLVLIYYLRTRLQDLRTMQMFGNAMTYVSFLVSKALPWYCKTIPQISVFFLVRDDGF